MPPSRRRRSPSIAQAAVAASASLDRRRCRLPPRAASIGASPGARPERQRTWVACYDVACPAERGAFTRMPNIKQQERRVRTSARQRLENLRWRSSSKTVTRRLLDALDEGDQERVAAEHRELVRTLDKAAAQGAMHPNKAARKKSQAARLVAGSSD